MSMGRLFRKYSDIAIGTVIAALLLAEVFAEPASPDS
jgi:hypothetical protein